MKTIPAGITNLARRTVNCEVNFVKSVVAKGFSETDAWLIFNEYRARKAIKIDLANERYVVKHGALWDLGVLKTGLEFAKAR